MKARTRGFLAAGLIVLTLCFVVASLAQPQGQQTQPQQTQAQQNQSQQGGAQQSADQTPEQAKQGEERKAYADEVRKSYNFRFGDGKISIPGNAAIEGNDFVQAGAFPKATYCAVCHAQAYNNWRQALHSNSFRTPFYRTSVNILLRSKGIEFRRHCDSCHNP